tara:strand:+ start:1746 stop:2291 length:546 start_codon:yes stop_codon:yes gene_type:complete
MLKKILLVSIVIITLTSCSSKVEFVPIEKITDSEKNYSIEDFKQISFKSSYEYSVEDLPGAVSAYFGFIKNSEKKPEDYEIRFYPTHSVAVQKGIKYADNITGEDACIKKECSLWTEDLNHRVHLEGGLHDTWNGTPDAKYQTYIIHGNFILMCPGYNEDDALNKCTIIVEKLDLKPVEQS